LPLAVGFVKDMFSMPMEAGLETINRKKMGAIGIIKRSTFQLPPICPHCGFLTWTPNFAGKSRFGLHASVSPYGFPRHRGGPAYYAAEVGFESVAANVENFQKGVFGRWWHPAETLLQQSGVLAGKPTAVP
jgi:hypothetical protein